MDYIEQLPPSNGNNSIMVIVDKITSKLYSYLQTKLLTYSCFQKIRRTGISSTVSAFFCSQQENCNFSFKSQRISMNLGVLDLH
jgi:hypothetical protein